MIIVCKSCKASFLVPPGTFANGPRTVRCAKCGGVWKEMPPSKASTPPPKPKPIHQPQQTVGAPPPPFPPTVPAEPVPSQVQTEQTPAFDHFDYFKRLLSIALSICIGIVLFTASAFIAGHSIVINYFPELQPVYINLGLAEDPVKDNLILQNITSVRRYQDGAMQLVIQGEIKSNAAKRQVVPAISVEAMGPDGHIIESWRITPPTATMAPGSIAPFTSSIISPDETVVEVNLSFVEPPHDEQ